MAEDAEFSSFFRAEYPRLVRALYLLTRGDQAEAEDLAQEAMARAFDRWERLRRMRSPRGYVFRVALNLNRRRMRNWFRSRTAAEIDVWNPPDPAATAEAIGDVHRALARLPSRHREILVLADCLDMKPEELRHVLGVSPGAARVRLHRARVSFRDHLGEGLGETENRLKQAVMHVEPPVDDGFERAMLKAKRRARRRRLAAGAFGLIVGAVGVSLLWAAFLNGSVPQRLGTPPGGRYEATALVLEAPARGSVLCVGSILDSYPPKCVTSVPVRNWNWDDVEGEQRASGVTWGEYHMEGTYDGTYFTVLEAGPPQTPAPEEPEIETPCAEPEGGWVAPDPSRTGEGHFQAAQRAAEAEPDFAGVWIGDLAPEPDSEDQGPFVLNAAFTSDLERHREELRELWGGPLCVIRAAYSFSELQRIRKVAPGEVGLAVTWSGIDVTRNQVEFGVVTIDPETRAALAERYGEGTVEVFPVLRPIP